MQPGAESTGGREGGCGEVMIVRGESYSNRDGSIGNVAIVGMACTFPKARNVRAFWNNIVQGVDAIAEVNPQRWDPAVFYDPTPGVQDKVYCKRGGYLENSFAFNPLRFGTMPRAVEGAEPDQFLVLRCAHEALEDAGCGDRVLDGERAAFVLGRGNYLGVGLTGLLQRGMMAEQTVQILRRLHPELSEGELERLREAMRNHVPSFGAEQAPGLIPNISSGRVANRFGLMGPNFTVDAACASSLIATDIAVSGLSGGRHDLVLIGGVHVFSDVPFLQVFSAMGALSRGSVIRPFDHDCDGTMAGEGVGVLVLKRLADAERDGNRIYAVIKGVGTSSDGRAKSVTAPRVEGEELALRRAYDAAGVDPATVGLIEAHGTGTPVGDEAEIAALLRVFGPRGGAPPTVALGSVKSMIGHAMPAAGSAGLIKTALALYHKLLPPTLNCHYPAEALCGPESRFYVNSETRPWIHGRDAPRRAGVNAFGFGGVNAHVVLEEYAGRIRGRSQVSLNDGADTPHQDSPETVATPLLHERESEVIVLSAVSREMLLGEIAKLRGYVAAAKGVRLIDIARTLNAGTTEDGVRLAIVALSLDDLDAKLARAADKLAKADCHKINDAKGIYYLSESEARGGKVAFLFPGEGAQYVNMLADLCVEFPEVRERFDAADRSVRSDDRSPPSGDIFPPPAFSEAEREAAEQRLWSIERAVEAVLTADGAMLTVLRELGVRADLIAGHSGGEWVATVAAGLFDVDDFIASMPRLDQMYRDLSTDRSIPTMAMLAVGAGREQVEKLAAEVHREIHIANDNCPHQVVIVTGEEDAAPVIEHLRSRRVFVERLPYDRGYHTPAFTYICGPLKEYFSSLGFNPAHTPLYSCATARPYPDDAGAVVQMLANTFATPLLFRQTVEAMYDAGARVFVEVGPRANLSGFVDDILRGRHHAMIPTNHHRRSGVTTLHHAVARLAALHVPMDLGYLYRHRDARVLSMDAAADSVIDPDAAPGTIQITLCYPHLKLPEGYRVSSAALESTTSGSPGISEASPRSDTEGPVPLGSEGSGSGQAAFNNQRSGAHVSQNDSQPRDRAPHAGSAGMIHAHMELMEQTLAAHEDIMRAYLGVSNADMADSGAERGDPVPVYDTPRAMPPTPDEEAEPSSPSDAYPGVTERDDATSTSGAVRASNLADEHDASVRSAPVATEQADLADALMSIVADKTGYPPEMLGVDLDLEADLGIDSIKRIEILGSLQRQAEEQGVILAAVDMEEVARLRTLRQVLEHLQAAASDVAPQEHSRGVAQLESNISLAFAGQIVEHDPGNAIAVVRDMDLSEDVYLLDHHFDPDTSEYDRDRDTLNVVPMTVSVAMMAEVAALLVPGQRVVGVRGVQAGKWVDVEPSGPRVTLRITGRVGPNENEVRTAIYRANASKDDGDQARSSSVAEATILLARDYPRPAAPQVEPLVAERTPSHTARQMYDLHRMFHGPRFQGVVALDAIGENGLSAQLEVLPFDNLFASNPNPRFHVDPFLLDAAGQLVGYWPVEFLSEGFVLFPIRLEELTLHRENLHPGERATCHLRVRSVAHRQFVADMDIVDGDGRLWMRIKGWEDWRFHWPRSFYDFWRFPREGIASDAVALDVPGSSHHVEVRRMAAEGELRAALWEKLWAYLICSRRELAEFLSMAEGPRRTEWIVGRSAAKDAVRSLVQRETGLKLYPADVEIEHDAAGRPVASGRWQSMVGKAPQVSIAHKGRLAIAAAADAEVGVDLESVASRADGFLEAAFTSEERVLLQESGLLDDEWISRAWAAKEAAGKAWGVGLSGDPKSLRVAEVDRTSGLFVIAARKSAGEDRRAAVQTTCDGGYVVALALVEQTEHARTSA
ncbi:MAG: polyketide synthase dehydratase domain-containing protein [Phycisphaerae bacterium]|nr:polyketide synthase dehydratase domain-containing protein [Phycisphaerae bacterium]